jgi:hypothetical protein
VTNLQTGFSYDDSGAFNAIADAIDDGQPLEAITLRIPPGKTAYVMRIPQRERAPIYIKVQLGSGGLVLARSFHYSEEAETEDT